MVLVLGVGVGTFLFIFFAVLLILVILIFHKSMIGKIIFAAGLVVFIIVFAILGSAPTADVPKETDIVDKWYIIVFFSIAIFLGLIVAIVAYLLVVLLYQDFAMVIPT